MREKRTLWIRIQRNVKRAFTQPFQPKRVPEHLEQDLIDLAEFTGLEREVLVTWVDRQRDRRISDEFNWLAPTSAPQYGWFYRGSRTYLFADRITWDRAVENARPDMKCLDFGGGGGRNALGMASKGAVVFYVDIGILNSSFVSFLARKRGLDVTVIDPMVQDGEHWRVDTAEAARLEGDFDLIVCDNVLEHIPDYHLVLQKLCAALRPGGRLLECTPFKREKVYLFKRAAEWDVHLLPSVSMQEAMDACGMTELEDGLWQRPERADTASS